ncbi:MAG: class I SAM-dependent methyltransferase [Candidatus Hydrogenedentes bacterium]|nr:class I SAM-dependent methyltransferase [Candidatus Hydrogenedentota bacterium]
MVTNLWESYWSEEENHDWWEKPAREVRDVIQTLSPVTHSRVLDLGCGLGRHSVALAQAGYVVTATDASETAMTHLRCWAGRLGITILSRVCDVLEQPFDPESFDVVIGYNVIYHGTRECMAKAIEHVWTLLRPGGLFFFTCPTREDGKYGHGDLIAAHTYAATKSIIPGDVHYFASREDLDALLAVYRLLSIHKDEGYWMNKGERQFFSNWQVLAEKR